MAKIKKLELKREQVKKLGVRSGVRTGDYSPILGGSPIYVGPVFGFTPAGNSGGRVGSVGTPPGSVIQSVSSS